MKAVAVLALCALAAAGCAHYPLNVQQTRPSGNGGYRFPEYVEERGDPADELFVCLTFSGGGTRAAAFAHGALLHLSTTDIGRGRMLLDEVDCIAGISGGAFAAAYYGLFGKAGLATFHERFLKRNIQVELAERLFNPANLVRLASPYFSRIDLAAELYDETVFERRTFKDLPTRPLIILHATSMGNGAPFEFTQDEFDFLGSDLAEFPVARAVAASSAFPFLLSPVSLRSYPTPDGYTLPQDVSDALESREDNQSRYHWAREHIDLMTPAPKAGQPAEEKWVHLLDGGLADNIGLRSILRAYDRSGGFLRQRINQARPLSEPGGLKRLVVIAINARTDPPEALSRRERSPGLVDVFLKTATVSMETVTFDTLDLALQRQRERDQAQTNIRVCNERIASCQAEGFRPLAREIRTCFIHIDFEGLPSPDRDELLAFPTTFALSADQLSRLRQAASTLLEGSADFQQLLRVLREEPSVGAGLPDVRGNCS